MKKNNLFFIIATLAIFPLPQLAIDVYLPSLPAIAKFMHTSDLLLQLTLTVFIFSLGITQLIYGPSSDRFGRRPVLLIGTIIFLLGSIACTFAQSITQLLVFRTVQGIGMGCGFTIASAIIGESFEGNMLAKMTTFSSMIYSLSPILAPALGGYIQHYMGWQGNFAFLAIFTALLLVVIYFFIPETNKNLNPQAMNIKKLSKIYLHMFRSSKFLGHIGTLTLTFGIMVTFNVVGPFLLQDVLRVPVIMYGQLLLLVGAAYFLGTICNSQLLRYFNTLILITGGLLLMLLSSIMLILSGWFGWFSVTSVMLSTCITMFSAGFVFPNSFAKALEVFSTNLGSASAFIGSAALIGTSLISIIIAHIPNHQEQSIGYMFLIQTMLAIICLLIALMRKDSAFAKNTAFNKTIKGGYNIS